MTIEELGTEYFKKADELAEKVKILKQKAEALSPEKRKRYNKRIYSLLSDAIECKKIARHLCDYYKKKEEF